MKRWQIVTIVGSVFLVTPLLWQSSARGGGGDGADGLAIVPAEAACAADLVRDGIVDARDMFEMIVHWGPCLDCAADLDHDRRVDEQDLAELLLALGPCRGAGEAAATLLGHACAVEDGAFITADGGCKDLASGLVWSSKSLGDPGVWRWDSAMDRAEGSAEAGYTDWRLPTVEELQTVIANGAQGHFAAEFDNHFVADSGFWTNQRAGQRAWAVHIASTVPEKFLRSTALVFVAVRDAGSVPPPPPGNCNNNGRCDPGEDCESCGDCAGKQNGKPAGRYCCGNGILEGPEGDGSVVCDGNP